MYACVCVCVRFLLTSPVSAAMPVDRLSLLALRRSLTPSLESPSELEALTGSVSAEEHSRINGVLSS